MANSQKAYASAGVDIDRAESLLDQAKPALKKAVRPESLGSIGSFGGFFDISKLRMKHPVLVSSTDSVGTKGSVAVMANNFRNLGADIVNHCANDIAVCGAEPLFFLDYYATGKLNDSFVPLMRGLAKACQNANIALVGGETAEMPGVYASGECDLVGSIVGAVEKSKIITGQSIRPGDTIIGLKSSGLHTNGYSLARNILFKSLGLNVNDSLPGQKSTVGNALLKPHTNYSTFLLDAFRSFNRANRASVRKNNHVFGVAHITGGGLVDNLPRILPDNCDALIETNSWKTPPLFQILNEAGNVSFEERYEVFNMGIGLAMVVSQDFANDILKLAKAHRHNAWIIGEIKKGRRQVILE